MNLAHFFTFLRIGLSPFFSIFYLGYERFGISFSMLSILLFFLLLISEFSDVLDGFLARRSNQVTDLGKVLDPMADSITHISLFFSFTQGVIQLPIALVLIFFYRDFLVSTLRTLCALKGVALAARSSGKIKTILQALAAFFIVFSMVLFSFDLITLDQLQSLSLIVTSVAAIYTAISSIDYFYANRIYIQKALRN